jgi:hypothetical protein
VGVSLGIAIARFEGKAILGTRGCMAGEDGGKKRLPSLHQGRLDIGFVRAKAGLVFRLRACCELR